MTNPTNPFVTQPTGEWFSGNTLSSVSLDQMLTYAQGQAAAPVPQPAQPITQTSDWEEKPGNFYFEEYAYIDHFEMKRKQKKEYYKSIGQSPIWSEQLEIMLVNQLHQNWFGEPYDGPESWGYPDLDLDKLEKLPLRKRELTPFKIEYGTIQEIKLRLNNTAIAIKGHPYVVKAVQKAKEDFTLLVNDGSNNYQVKYSDLTDLRSIPPMYLNISYTGWLCRHPARVYQQGLNRHNTSLRTVDCDAVQTNPNPDAIVTGMRSRQNRKWDTTLESLLQAGELSATRLSDDLAVRTWKGKALACFRGRRLGFITGNEIKVLDEDDLLQSWIERPAKEAGLELRG